jgi:hypothetical protein
MRALIYLDVSGVPGPLIPWIQPRNFPALRILKIRSKEIDNAMFTSLVKAFKLRLCSVDVSHNKLSDDIIDVLGEFCIPDIELRSDAAFRVEGKLVPSDQGTQTYGPFISVEESESSGAFSHPERFFIDAPMYMAQADEAPQETQAPRAYGRGPIWDDSADAVSAVVPEYGLAFEHFMPARGITHLHLSRNRVSAFGIEKLLRTSNGQIEHLACDTMSMLPLETKHLKHWPKSARLSGIVGAAHIFRPVFASNLRSLRIHHSLVTQIPTLELDGISTLARLYICENALLPRIEAAYAQAFVPDMNPRLMSLTLTCLPRRSSGPLIQRIIAFLKHLSVQECAIQDMTAVAGYRRGPGLLMGLRHLRLEFEDDAMEDGFSTSEDFDAEELLNSGEQGFSFFENERVRRLEPSGTKKKPGIQDPSNSSAGGPAKHQPVNSARDDEESVTYQGEWNGLAFSIPVWIGTKSSSIENPVLSDYRRLVVQHNLREGVGPATPGQILAGAPEKSYVFHIAWGLAIMPQQLPKPAMNDLTGMKDVLKALKTYRLAGRKKYLELAGENGNHPAPLGEPHFYWTGKLVVARTEPLK